MKTYKIRLVTNEAMHYIEMDLRPTEAKLLERVGSLLDAAIPNDWSRYTHGYLAIEEA